MAPSCRLRCPVRLVLPRFQFCRVLCIGKWAEPCWGTRNRAQLRVWGMWLWRVVVGCQASHWPWGRTLDLVPGLERTSESSTSASSLSPKGTPNTRGGFCLFFVAEPQGMRDPSSSTRDGTWTSYSENAESQPLECQGSPLIRIHTYIHTIYIHTYMCEYTYICVHIWSNTRYLKKPKLPIQKLFVLKQVKTPHCRF